MNGLRRTGGAAAKLAKAVVLCLLALAGGLALRPAGALAQETNQAARTLVHLLDYIAQDYGGAVAGGQVVSPGEYQEMVEFAQSAGAQKPLFFDRVIEIEIQKQLGQLRQLVQGKADAVAVAKLARDTSRKVMQAARLEVAPARWPDLVRGRQLFLQNCVACHGPEGRGDGPSAATLNPKPRDFHDPERLRGMSPFQAFNTISLGIPNTGMAGFAQLPSKDIWHLAFYVVSIRHGGSLEATAQRPAPAGAEVPLATVATLSDEQLEGALTGTPEQRRRALAALRLRSESGGGGNTLPVALSNLDAALAAYKAGQFAVAEHKALAAYLDGIEPVEARLKAVDPGSVVRLEQRMAAVRAAVKSRLPADAVASEIAEAAAAINQTADLLASKTLSPWLVFTMASAIILREGFEAILVIIAILGVLRAVGSRKGALWVHGGWVSALALGGAAWICSGWLMAISGLQRELMEGITSLLAVVVLLWLGFWLHSKTEIGRWKAYIEGRVKAALEGGNLAGLAGISFLAVFREAFETVLFLSALGLEAGPLGQTAMASGVACSLAGVFILAWLLLRFSARVPVRTLFGVSASLMGVLAIVLVGKGLHSLQEAGWLSITALPVSLRWDLVGFFPTIETTVSQCVAVLLTAALWFYGRKPSAVAVGMEATADRTLRSPEPHGIGK